MSRWPGVLEDMKACDDLGDYNERRRLTLEVGFRAVAMALLADEEPEEIDLALLYLAVVDAAMSGDDEILNCAPQVAERLNRYLPEDAQWADTWRGRIWGLVTAAALANSLLRAEAVA